MVRAVLYYRLLKVFRGAVSAGPDARCNHRLQRAAIWCVSRHRGHEITSRGAAPKTALVALNVRIWPARRDATNLARSDVERLGLTRLLLGLF